MALAEIQHDALWWMHVVLPRLNPRIQPGDFVQLMQKVRIISCTVTSHSALSRFHCGEWFFCADVVNVLRETILFIERVAGLSAKTATANGQIGRFFGASYSWCTEVVYARRGVTKLRLASGMRLFGLCEKLCICFLFSISIANCRNIAKWYCGSWRVVQDYFYKSFQKELWSHRNVDCKQNRVFRFLCCGSL